MIGQTAIANYLKFSGHKSIDLKVALIDCDGILYDSMKNHTRAWVKLMKKNGIKCTRDEFYLYDGMTGAGIIKLMFKKGVGKNITDDEAWELYKVKGRYLKELGEIPVMPGALEMLTKLKEAGIERVLVTGSREPSVLERIDNDFPELFSEKRVTAHDTRHGKPNPEPYLKGMAKAEAKPNQCIVIENAPLGVQAGHAAGCFTIGITTGPISEKELTKAGADIVFKSMEDFVAALPELIADFKETTR